jgi:NAD(P)-dependent dehydrogenase (short-subunit alcohol dehydrogenase family)
MRLMNKVAIIMGGGAGIGGGAARAMAREGAIVVIGEIDRALGEKALADIQEAGGKGWLSCADCTDAAAITRLVDDAAARFGQVDILFNTVGGVSSRGTILETTEDQWDELYRRNVKSTFHSCRAVLPHMIRRKSGSIINMSSTAGISARRRLAAYSSAKGAILSLSRQMAADFGLDGVRVNALCPGPVITERSASKYKPGSAALESRAKEQLLGRMGEPSDVAGLVVFLASDEASWVTGHVFPIDGGSTAGQGLER